MKLTSLIFVAAVSCSLLLPLQAEENYSLWPRRPAELEQARNMVREQKYEEAVTLLRPFVGDDSIAGREARRIVASVNVRRYLTRAHPRARVVVVNRGDTMGHLVQANGCPREMLMLLNGIVEPSSIKLGQRLVVVRMDLRMEIHVSQREVTVWDGEELVAVYDVRSHESLSGTANAETVVAAREGLHKGAAVSRRSEDFLSSNRVLRLGNGWVLASEEVPLEADTPVLRFSQQDINELGLLMYEGGRASLVWDEEHFNASEAAAVAPPQGDKK